MLKLGSLAIFLLFFICCFEISEAGSFWFFTDPHADWLYRPGSKKKESLCREGKGDAGFYGQHGCYPPLYLEEAAIQQMSIIDPNPTFVIHGGDSYPHYPNESEPVAISVYNSSHLLGKYFPNKPIIYTLGNHDLYPNHCILPNSSWLNKIGDQIADFMNEYQLESFKRSGYYVSYIGDLKILVLNTNYYFILNRDTLFMRKDIGNQWQYIKNELEKSKKNQQKVLVVGHIPPGFSERFYISEFFKKYENDNYLKAFEGYGDLIIGHLYGHTHTDSFKLSKDNGAMFIAPSLDSQLHNPAMARRFVYDDETFKLLYYEQYYTELEQDNQEMKITWKLEYATNQEPYNLPDLTLGSMTQLAERLNSNKTLFNYYYAYNNIMSKQDNCGFRCKRNQMCAIVQPYWDKYLTCLLIGPKHYLPKSYTDVQDELD